MPQSRIKIRIHYISNGMDTFECQNERLQLNLQLRRPLWAVGSDSDETIFR